MLNERARRLLEESRVGYETFPHREAFTAQGVAAASHVSGWRMAKVLVVSPDQGPPVMVVIPASCRLKPGALADLLGKRQVSLLPEAEVERLFPDCEAGAMPPFGGLYGLPVYVDACFSKSEEIVFQAGNHREAVRMKYADFERLARPVVGEFCRVELLDDDSKLTLWQGVATGKRLRRTRSAPSSTPTVKKFLADYPPKPNRRLVRDRRTRDGEEET